MKKSIHSGLFFAVLFTALFAGSTRAGSQTPTDLAEDEATCKVADVLIGDAIVAMDVEGTLVLLLDSVGPGREMDGSADTVFALQAADASAVSLPLSVRPATVIACESRVVLEDANGKRLLVMELSGRERNEVGTATQSAVAQGVGLTRTEFLPRAATLISDSTELSSWPYWVLSVSLPERDIYYPVLPPDDCPPNCGGGHLCDAGGPGASSCSVNDHPSGMPGCSVSCMAGWYACCSRPGIFTMSHCHCRVQ